MRKISLIIPVYNALSLTAYCLKSVFKYTTNNQEIQTDIIVVNDGSDQHVTEYLEKFNEKFSNYKVINNETNLGFVKTCNRGFKAADGEIIVLLNNDTIVTPGYIEKIIKCFDSDKAIGAASPISSNSAFFAIPLPSGYDIFEMSTMVEVLSEERYPEAITPEGFCLCIRKKVVDEIGYFDEIFGIGYCEESDYCMRVKDRGYRTVCIDSLYIFHKRMGTFGSRKSELYKKNRKIFNRRWLKRYNILFKKHMDPLPIQYLIDKINIVINKHYHSHISPPPKRSLRNYIKSFHLISSKRSIWIAIVLTIYKLIRILPILLFIAIKNNLVKLFKTSPKKENISVSNHDLQKIQENISHKFKITFILPEVACYGGVISVINLMSELILMGVTVKIVVLYRSSTEYNLFSSPIYLFKNEFLEYFPDTDLCIATYWLTAYLVHDLSKLRKQMKTAYFIQDYEAWFYPEEDIKARQKVIRTYDFIKNKFAKTQWLKDLLEKDNHQCFKINPGLNTNVFYPLKRTQNENVTIIAMYRPGTARRGAEILLKVLDLVHQKYPKVRLFLFGEDPSDCIYENPSFPYEYYGKLSHEELVNKYRTSDICIDTSHFHGFGRMGIEAMACGCACVLTDSGGVGEYAIDGNNCLLANSRDVDQLFMQVCRIIEEPTLRNKLSRNGIKTAQKYEEIIAAIQFLNWAKEICNE